MYKIIRDLLFLIPPEKAHNLIVSTLKIIFKINFIRKLIYNYCNRYSKSFDLLNLKFKNKCGLAAGFDKNGKYLYELGTFGFAFIEVGTITPKPQKGNPLPRLFRLVKDNALINRMGLNNDGVEIVYKNILNYRKKYPNENVIIGANIGKNKDTTPENGYFDILQCFNKLYDLVDYFTINISCPNVKNNSELQDPKILSDILKKLNNNRNNQNFYKPIFLKISPDLSFNQIDQIIELIRSNNIDGLIISNTTTKYENLKTSRKKIEKIAWGGLSGKPLKYRTDEIISYVKNKYTKKEFIIIASGGIITEEDAIDKINKGADLLQLYTGFIYRGPFIVRKINKKINSINNNQI